MQAFEIRGAGQRPRSRTGGDDQPVEGHAIALELHGPRAEVEPRRALAEAQLDVEVAQLFVAAQLHALELPLAGQ